MLSACSTRPVLKEMPVGPPEQFLVDCQEPGRAGIKTNYDLAEYTLKLQEALRLCNADKAAIRTWVSTIKEK